MAKHHFQGHLFIFLWLITFCQSCIKEKTDPEYFDISPTALLLSADKQEFVLSVNCDMEWAAKMKNGAWAKITTESLASAATTGKITVQCDMNANENEREDYISFTAGNTTIDVLLFQEGVSSLFSERSVTITDKQSASFTLTTSSNWQATLTDGAGGEPNWFDISTRSGGPGQSTITVTPKEPNHNIGDRTAMIKFVINGNPVYVNVCQKQTDAILLSSDKVELTNKSGSFSIAFATNVKCNISIHDDCSDWISQVTTKGLNKESVEFKVKENNDEEVRVGHITVYSDGVSETVTVYQAEKDILVLENELVNVTEKGGSFAVTVKTNVEYSVTIPDDAKWITVERETKSIRSDVVHFKVEANEGYDSRTAKVIVKDINSALSQTLTVTQEQTDMLEIDSNTIQVSNKGETFSIAVTHNVDFKATIDDDCRDWITEVKTKAVQTDEILFVASRTDLDKERRGHITLTDGAISRVVTIVQPEKDYIRLNPDVEPAEFYGGKIKVKLEANVDYHINESSLPDWISVESTESDHFIIRVAPNLQNKARTNIIEVIGGTEKLTDQLTISQKARPSGTYLDQNYIGVYNLNGRDWRGEPMVSQLSILRYNNHYACRVLFPNESSVISFSDLGYMYEVGTSVEFILSVYTEEIVSSSPVSGIVEQMTDDTVWVKDSHGRCFIIRRMEEGL